MNEYDGGSDDYDDDYDDDKTLEQEDNKWRSCF